MDLDGGGARAQHPSLDDRIVTGDPYKTRVRAAAAGDAALYGTVEWTVLGRSRQDLVWISDTEVLRPIGTAVIVFVAGMVLFTGARLATHRWLSFLGGLGLGLASWGVAIATRRPFPAGADDVAYLDTVDRNAPVPLASLAFLVIATVLLFAGAMMAAKDSRHASARRSESP